MQCPKQKTGSRVLNQAGSAQAVTLILILALLLSACAVTDRKPIIDTRGVNVAQYEADLAECTEVADQVNVEQEVIRESLFAAIFMAALGAWLGDSDFAASAAATGAVAGATGGVGLAIEERNTVLHNCMWNRGYVVLN